jgi:hypothetical protein
MHHDRLDTHTSFFLVFYFLHYTIHNIDKHSYHFQLYISKKKRIFLFFFLFLIHYSVLVFTRSIHYNWLTLLLFNHSKNYLYIIYKLTHILTLTLSITLTHKLSDIHALIFRDLKREGPNFLNTLYIYYYYL